MVRAKPLQAFVDSDHRVGARAASLAPHVRCPKAELGGQDHLIAAAIERTSDKFLRQPVAIDLRRIEKCDPGI